MRGPYLEIKNWFIENFLKIRNWKLNIKEYD